MTHKRAMRTRLQPQAFRNRRSCRRARQADADAALESGRLPAVLKPVDAGGQRGLFLLNAEHDLEHCFPEALADSPSGETLLEEYLDGIELNGLVIVRIGEATVVTV